jgi:hypothetical protein
MSSPPPRTAPTALADELAAAPDRPRTALADELAAAPDRPDRPRR